MGLQSLTSTVVFVATAVPHIVSHAEMMLIE